MKSLINKGVLLGILALSLAGCAGITPQQRNVAIGVAAGAAIGHVVGGDTGATLGGAALGGVIGSQIQ